VVLREHAPFQQLQTFLQEPILIVDEAHHLRNDVLEDQAHRAFDTQAHCEVRTSPLAFFSPMSAPLDDMPIFAAVVRHGTLTAAARSLGVTKQSISQRIVRLEQRIGVELLLRSTRALRLTEAGARYYESCVSIISQVEEAELDAQESQDSASGTVRVTAPVGLSAGLIMPAVYAFQRSYPAIRVELLFEEKVVNLIRDGVDVAVRAGSVKSTPSFIARSLFDVANVIVASSDFLRLHGSPWDPGALRSGVGHAAFNPVERDVPPPLSSIKPRGSSLTPRCRAPVNPHDVA
jgi:molybdenum-dependent DNA-binding transcriptional regulator ModE